MENPDAPAPESAEIAPQCGVFGRHRWAPFVLPMLAFMLLGYLDPQPPASLPPENSTSLSSENDVASEAEDTTAEPGGIPYQAYPLVYIARLAGTLVMIAMAWSIYRTFAFRVHWLAIAVGAVGVVLWVGICRLGIEEMLIPAGLADSLGVGNSRTAYNPFEQLGEHPIALVGFLAVRFFGLVLVVPVIEEFFLRGFLMRFVQDQTWWKIPIGLTNGTAWAAVVAYAALTHPGEMFAGVVWFSLVTWLVIRTKNIWDAVAAHAVTNLLLGVYVVTFETWELW